MLMVNGGHIELIDAGELIHAPPGARWTSQCRRKVNIEGVVVMKSDDELANHSVNAGH